MSLARPSIDDLHAVVQRLPAEMRTEPTGRVIGVFIAVIAHFFGRVCSAYVIRHCGRKGRALI
jgi:hypothetical protein